MTGRHDVRVVSSGCEHLPYGWRCTCGRGEGTAARTQSIAWSAGLRHARAAVRRAGGASEPRVVVDFAEPTLRAIWEALLEQISDGHLRGDKLSATIQAECMVARALGEPVGDGWEQVDDRGPRWSR